MGTETGWKEQTSQETAAAVSVSSYQTVPLWQHCLPSRFTLKSLSAISESTRVFCLYQPGQ